MADMTLDLQHNLERQVIERYVESFCAYLGASANARPIELNRAWVGKFLREPGVYSIFSDNKVVYVGESGSLRARMTDLLDSRHHVLRRNLGLALFAGEPGFKKATANERFPPEFEARLNEYIEAKFRVCMVSVVLGRKEIEECLIDTHKPIYNKKGRRLL